jgi:hypothetical protein
MPAAEITAAECPDFARRSAVPFARKSRFALSDAEDGDETAGIRSFFLRAN